MSPSLAASRARADTGWLFAASFRPFFLGAALYAAAAVPVWIWMHVTGVAEVAGMPALAWHAHEMVFGYLPAVMAGYLLSATPNWSGRLPASGRPLAGLFAVWVAGRIVPLFVPLAAGAAFDAAFPLAMAFVLMREARVKAHAQSRHGLALFPLLAVASVAHRLLATDYETAAMLGRLGIAVGVLLIAAVGGRLVPSFTRNALAGRGADRVPEPYGRFDVVSLFVATLGLGAWVAAPATLAAAILLALSAVVHALRLARWRGWLVRRPDILALHAGYAWAVAGMGLAALAAAPAWAVAPDAALHAFSAGAIGGMTIAVMSRLSATRGAGARADATLTGLAVACVNLGAALRVAAPFFPAWYVTLLVAGATLWSAGFGLFVLSHVVSRRRRS